MSHFVENQHEFLFLFFQSQPSLTTFLKGCSVCLQWMHPSVQEEHLQLEASVRIDKSTTDSWSNAVVAQYFHVEIVPLMSGAVLFQHSYAQLMLGQDHWRPAGPS